jgi:valyl-tRNA synthetase
LADAEGQIARLETLLGSTFAEKAPPAVVEKERQRLTATRETAAKLREQLAHID